jgi:hypothetical protein
MFFTERPNRSYTRLNEPFTPPKQIRKRKPGTGDALVTVVFG